MTDGVAIHIPSLPFQKRISGELDKISADEKQLKIYFELVNALFSNCHVFDHVAGSGLFPSTINDHLPHRYQLPGQRLSRSGRQHNRFSVCISLSSFVSAVSFDAEAFRAYVAKASEEWKRSDHRLLRDVSHTIDLWLQPRKKDEPVTIGRLSAAMLIEQVQAHTQRHIRSYLARRQQVMRKQEEEKVKNQRLPFRSIIRFHFKNLDDNSGADAESLLQDRKLFCHTEIRHLHEQIRARSLFTKSAVGANGSGQDRSAAAGHQPGRAGIDRRATHRPDQVSRSITSIATKLTYGYR